MNQVESGGSLDARVRRLERQLSHWRSMGIAALAAIALAALLGAAPAKVADEMRARRFVVVDQDGRPRAELAALDSGMTRLVLRDKSGKGRATVQLRTDGAPNVFLSDSDEYARVVLLDEPAVGPGLSLTGLNGSGIRVDADAVPALTFFDKTGKITWRPQ